MTFVPNEHLLSLKGKDYLPVAWRIAWLRNEHPDWAIQSELVHIDYEKREAVFKATVLDTERKLVGTGYGSETARDFADFIEKAETKAVGRALAVCGFGTQFAPELDEEERLADSPQPRGRSEPDWDAGKKAEALPQSKYACVCEGCNAELTEAQKKYSIQKFKKALCPQCQKAQ